MKIIYYHDCILNSITDWKEAAKWLSEWSSAVAVPVMINKTNDYANKDIKQTSRRE